MESIATKKATKQFQKFFDLFGEFGGIIETNNPDNWWELSLDPLEDDGTSYTYLFGQHKKHESGDYIHDNMFDLTIQKEGSKIIKIKLNSCEILYYGTSAVVGDDGILYWYWGNTKEKYYESLQKMFSEFMETVSIFGPYLSNPKSVTCYKKEDFE